MKTASAGEANVSESEQARKDSAVFLAVFTVFLCTTFICVVVTCVGIALAQPAGHDTQFYWVSGHLLVHGHNPYDAARSRQLELELGRHFDENQLITRNPPPALLLMAPLGLLGPRVAVVAWSLLLAACLVVSVGAIRAMVEMPCSRACLLLAYFFAPAICCIEVGQTGLIPLLGLALFLRFSNSKPMWAGAALSLCVMKPHLLFPFGVALLAWIVLRRRWEILAGAVMAFVLESAGVMTFDPAVWSHYRAAMHAQHFSVEFISTLGAVLRFAVNRNALWLEFVPAAAGCAWAVWYFWRNRERWDWRTHGSLVTLVSVAVAPYAWITDQVLAIPAILFALLGRRRLRKGSVTLLMAIIAAKELQMIVSREFLSRWDAAVAVAWVAWYLYAVSGRGEDVALAEHAEA